MPVVETHIRTNIGSARQVSFEVVPGINATNVQEAIELIASTPRATIVTPVGVTPYSPTPSDTYLGVNFAGAVVILLPNTAFRNGTELVIKDESQNASTNNISIFPIAGQPIDGIYTNANPLVINMDGGGFRLIPRGNVWDIAP